MQVQLVQNNEKILVKERTDLERRQLILSFKKRISKHWVNPLVKAKKWDGFFNYFESEKYIPVGLWKELLSVCELYNFDINKDFLKDIVDTSVSSEDVESYLSEFFKGSKYNVRYYQFDAVYNFCRYKKSCAELATSAGKTLIMFMTFLYLKNKIYNNKKFKMLVIVPNTGLVIQTFENFTEYNMGKEVHRLSMVYGDDDEHKITSVTDYDCVIGTYQSLINKPKEYFEHFDCVIVDEAHHTNAKTIKTILTLCRNSVYRVGLSGTLGMSGKNKDTAESFTIQSYIGPLVQNVSPKELIDNEYATPVEVKIFRLSYLKNSTRKSIYELLRRKNFDKGKLLQLEKDLAINSKVRLDFIIKLLEKTTKNNLVLFSSVEKEYGKNLYDTLRERINDKEVFYVEGKTKSDIREEYKERMEENQNRILIASYGTFSTGISIDNLHNIFLIESYKSEKIIKQSIGRGMRKMDGKDKVNIIDIVDDYRYDVKKHNYLYRHGLDRLQIYKQEEFPVKIYKIDLGEE